MMSYLWILLLGSLLASHGKTQEDETTQDPVDTVAEGEVDITADAGSDDANTATEPPPADTEPEAGVDPSEEDAVTPALLDLEETTPLVDAETTVEPGEGDDANDATEATEEDETEAPTLAADVPADAETTPEPEQPAVGDTETEVPTPGDALIETTVADGALTTQGAGSGVIDVEPEETTQSVEEEVSVVTDAPAIQEETGGDEKTTPAPIEEETTIASLIQEPEIVVNNGQGLKTEFDLSDALSDGTAENSQKKTRRTGNINAEPVKEEEKTSAQEGNSKPLAAVLSAIVVSAVGAVTGYFAYQKKKLCFKNRGEADPETGNNTVKADAAEAQSDPQVLSNLLSATQQ